MIPRDLPGHNLIEKGIKDLSDQRISNEALLVSIATSKLRKLGLQIPDLPTQIHDPEIALYQSLAKTRTNGAHSAYNALIRQLVSFSKALAIHQRNMLPTLTITRGTSFADRLRIYQIILDGQTIGSIGIGETKSFPIELGDHALSVKLDWCQTHEKTFAVSDQNIAFTVESNLKGIKILLALPMLLFPSSWLKLTQTLPQSLPKTPHPLKSLQAQSPQPKIRGNS